MIYVGIVGINENQRLIHRLRDHTKGGIADRWSRFSWFGFLPVNEDHNLEKRDENINVNIRDVMKCIEGVLIEAAEPLHNKKGGILKNANHYLQSEN